MPTDWVLTKHDAQQWTAGGPCNGVHIGSPLVHWCPERHHDADTVAPRRTSEQAG